MGKDDKPDREKIIKDIALAFAILLFFYGATQGVTFFYLLNFLALFSALLILKGIYDYLIKGNHATFIAGLSLMALLIFFGADSLVSGWISTCIAIGKLFLQALFCGLSNLT